MIESNALGTRVRAARELAASLVLALGALGALSGNQAARAADTFPQRPIRLVVPFTPGGPSDVIARMLAQGLSERLKQQAVVDNRPGGGSVIGTDIVAKAAPDGHVLLLASITHSINPALIGNLPYDSINGFIPVTMLVKAPGLLVAHPSTGIHTLKDLIAAAKAKPNAITYASSGTGSGGHLEMELLKSFAKIDLLHVPYKGASPALTDLLGGRVHLFLTSPVNVLSHIKSGKVNAIGITSKTRSPVLPDVASFSEGGVPGYDSTVWYALLAPARTPADVIGRLNTEAGLTMRSEANTRRLAEQSLDTVSTSPAEAAAFIKSEVVRWTKVIRDANIRPE